MSNTANVFLIRHGVSWHNYKSWDLAKKFGNPSPEHDALESDFEMTDPDLHPLGAYQIEYNAPKVEGINFKYVLVSPM